MVVIFGFYWSNNIIKLQFNLINQLKIKIKLKFIKL